LALLTALLLGFGGRRVTSADFLLSQ
jgi:hypothetical protein